MNALAMLCRFMCVTCLMVSAFSAEIIPGIEDEGMEERAKLIDKYLFQYFTLGADAPIDWFVETRRDQGAKWDFRMQYLSCGAGWDGKRQSWDTVFLHNWNRHVNPDKRRGVFGEIFIKQCVDNDFIPWLCFYNLAQSYPADYKPGPSQATPVNARNPSTMRAYWEMVKLTMELAAQVAPKPVVIQVEPDEWGHLLNKVAMDPLRVDIKVGSSGMPDVAEFPDNMIGFSDAWLKLRAKYAPKNVILFANPSAWDQNGMMSAQNWVRVFRQCHVDKWDGLILETGDREIGHPPKNNAPPYDEISTTGQLFNDLDEQMRYIETLYKELKLPIYFWQVACGNTYFRTCNQTPGHYADTLAQALLEDYPKNDMIARYVDVGCFGWVFSRGQDGSTSVYDRRKDGITNPEPIPGNLGHVSEFADDDGGYMRLRAGAYYKQPYPIKASAPIPSAVSEERAAKAKAMEQKKAQREARRKEREEARVAEQVKAAAWAEANAESYEVWLGRLRDAARKATKNKRPPRFKLEKMRVEVEIHEITSDKVTLRIPSMGSNMSYPLFEKLTNTEGLSIAKSVCRGKTSMDYATIAFFARRAGDRSEWLKHHRLVSGELQKELEAAFTTQ